MEQQQILDNRDRLADLNRSIEEKHNLPLRNFPSAVDDGNEQNLCTHIADLIKDIHPDFLFPKEFKDKESDQAMRSYDYSDSPLSKSIKNGDNETAELILAKDGITSKHLQRGEKIPSLEQAILEANQEIATLIMQKIEAKMKEKYKGDFIAAFGESPFIDAIQTVAAKKQKRTIEKF